MSYRQIQINGRSWSYKVGKSNVHLRDPDGKGQVIPWNSIGEYYAAPEVVYGQEWKVTPGHIKAWVESKSTITSQARK